MRFYSKKQRLQIRQLVASFISFVLFVYFAYHLVHGDMGYFAMRGVEDRLSQSKRDYIELKEDRVALENRVKRLRPDSLDLDMLDERSRAVLAFGHKDEVIIVGE